MTLKAIVRASHSISIITLIILMEGSLFADSVADNYERREIC